MLSKLPVRHLNQYKVAVSDRQTACWPSCRHENHLVGLRRGRRQVLMSKCGNGVEGARGRVAGMLVGQGMSLCKWLEQRRTGATVETNAETGVLPHVSDGGVYGEHELAGA